MIDDFVVGPSGHVFSLQAGSLYQLALGGAMNLPNHMRGIEWKKVAAPDTLQGNIVKIGAANNGLLYALTDDHRFWQYGLDTFTCVGQSGRWTEIAPVADVAPTPAPVVEEPPKFKPRTIGRYKAAAGPHQVAVKAGRYSIVCPLPSLTVERKDGRSWQPVHMDARHSFTAAEDQVLRLGAREAGEIELVQEAA